jgi:DNA-binding MarR family transcriptional regulator
VVQVGGAAGRALEPAVLEGRGFLIGSVFDPAAQHGDVDAKIVAALERLGQVFLALLRERAAEAGLSPIQARFLLYLLYHAVELRRVGQLAREFGLTPATVSDAVDSLEDKGLLRRERWPEDRRVVTLRLTPEGEGVARGLADWPDAVRERLPAAAGEREVVLRFLMGLIEDLQRGGIITVARMCVTCRFFRRDAHPGATSLHHCRLLDVPLADSGLRLDCPEHELARS